MIEIPQSQEIEIAKIERIMALMTKYNIAKIELDGLKLENTLPPKHVVDLMQNTAKQLTEDELLFDPMKGL